MQYVVFGDTGGHYKQLLSALLQGGMDERSCVLPEGVTIIHMGDLVHKGPQSLQVVQLVNRVMRANPGRWVQLMGNHESQYLGADWFWDDKWDMSEVSQYIQRWWGEGLLRVAYEIPVGGKVFFDSEGSSLLEGMSGPLDAPILFTHAGISPHFYRYLLEARGGVLGEGESLLPLFTDASFERATMPGKMLWGVEPEYGAGPVWAHGVDEVWAQWQRVERAPFHQVVGHITPFSKRFGFWQGTDERFQEESQFIPQARMSVAPLPGERVMIFADPGFSTGASRGPQPSLVFEIR